ncbi:MAG: ribosome maturation factor RimP [Candidatus Rokubacteria bacterium]|nr:ribosome maturation factor RimP [Candidatus Rokubacteria bacterium]
MRVSVGTEAHALSEAIEAVVAPVVRAHGLMLVDVELRGGGRRTTLRFFIDKPGGVSIADCQRFSEEVGDLLDVANLPSGSYDLEVSSPGLDRELKRERELRWAVGKRVRVWTREPVDGRRELEGRLAEVGEESLTLAEPDGRREIPRALVAKMRLEVDLRGPA